ncbi:MAG: ATP-binding protein [Cyclobacteriaceae bacterium]
MTYKNFRVNTLIRVIAIGGTTILCALLFYYSKFVSGSLMVLFIGVQIYSLYSYVEITNRKLNTFLDAIRYSDFSANFEADNHLGKTFHNLNESLKSVLDAFRNARKENEENLQYLDTLVQNVSVGILSYDQDGEVELLNAQACRLLAIPKVKTLPDLRIENKEAANFITGLKANESGLLRQGEDKHLAIQTAEMKMRNKVYRLVSIQNIRSELQQKELEAWQNLTRVLRHEIMNSIAPISSLVSTLNDIFEDEFKKKKPTKISGDVIDDISEALQTINSRSEALKSFVDGYRNFTQIPKPKIESVEISVLFTHIEKLMQGELSKSKIKFKTESIPHDLKMKIDSSLIEMVLINLVKNAFDAVKKIQKPLVTLKAFNESSSTIIEVQDNGPGIIPEAIDQIFIPFYTTKPGGSGIGLAVSRQIIQMHHGNLIVESGKGQTTFRIIL